MSNFWSWYVILLVVVNIAGYAVMLFVLRKMPKDDKVKPGEALEHEYDGIKELNNPLPRWWIWLFWITIVFSGVYLFLYPGLGNYKGYLNWSSKGQWQQEVKVANNKYDKIFDKYLKIPAAKLVSNSKAIYIGKRLFENNCATCHGANAKGAVGFPNLADNDWLFGGTEQAIHTSIADGRAGMMPPMGAAVGGTTGVTAVANYVRELSGQKADKALAKQGEAKFKQVCAACHGVNGKGNQALGAPNLTDSVWLYGGSLKAIEHTIEKGRRGEMPAHKDRLSKAKIHLLVAYVMSLSAKSSHATR